MTEDRYAGRRAVLKRAEEYTTKQRNKSYGEPDEDFQRIAKTLNGLGYRAEGRELKGHDVSVIMVALKLSRLMWSPDHQDSWDDIAGYAACGSETASLQAEREQPTIAVDAKIPPPKTRDRSLDSSGCGPGCLPRSHKLSGDCKYRLRSEVDDGPA